MATGTHTRRNFMRTIVAGTAIGALGACTITTSGGVTTLSLNVAKVVAYGQAGINAVSMILSVAAVSSAIGAPAVAIINTSATALEAALAAFKTTAGSAVTVSYDNTSVKTAVDSVLSDLKTVAANLSSAVAGASTSVSSDILSTLNTTLKAVETVLSAFEAVLGVAVKRSLMTETVPAMTEPKALSYLHAE